MTTKPYEELYQFHVQPFVHATQMESLAAYAASKGFRGFKSMYKKYVESLKAQSGTLYIENVTQFTNQPLELNAGEWEADDLGIHKKNGFNDEIACPHPIMPVERLVNIDTGEEKLQLAYKALKQGTYYSYFKPQFEAFGIKCDMLNWTNTYGKPDHTNHAKALAMLQAGYYLIALMNKGLWTSSGHFVVVWWADNKIHINDPASTRKVRTEGDPGTFRSQVKYYWWVDARAYNQQKEAEEDVTHEEWMQHWYELRKSLQDNDSSAYSEEARKWAQEVGLITGNGTEIDGEPNCMWEDVLTREQFATVLYRFAKIIGKA